MSNRSKSALTTPASASPIDADPARCGDAIFSVDPSMSRNEVQAVARLAIESLRDTVELAHEAFSRQQSFIAHLLIDVIDDLISSPECSLVNEVQP